jgi:hypothetical protein
MINRVDIYKIKVIREGNCQKDYKPFGNSTIEKKVNTGF